MTDAGGPQQNDVRGKRNLLLLFAVVGGLIAIPLSIFTFRSSAGAVGNNQHHLTVRAFGVVLHEETGPLETIEPTLRWWGWSLVAAYVVCGVILGAAAGHIARRITRRST